MSSSKASGFGSAHTFGAVALTLLAVTGFQPTFGADELSRAEAAATANLERAGGKQYRARLGQAFALDHASTIPRCSRKLEISEPPGFEAFVRVGSNGVVDEVLTRPDTAFTRCVGGKLTRRKLPAPPRADFWVRITVNLQGNQTVPGRNEEFSGQ